MKINIDYNVYWKTIHKLSAFNVFSMRLMNSIWSDPKRFSNRLRTINKRKTINNIFVLVNLFHYNIYESMIYFTYHRGKKKCACGYRLFTAMCRIGGFCILFGVQIKNDTKWCIETQLKIDHEPQIQIYLIWQLPDSADNLMIDLCGYWTFHFNRIIESAHSRKHAAGPSIEFIVNWCTIHLFERIYFMKRTQWQPHLLDSVRFNWIELLVKQNIILCCVVRIKFEQK